MVFLDVERQFTVRSSLLAVVVGRTATLQEVAFGVPKSVFSNFN